MISALFLLVSPGFAPAAFAQTIENTAIAVWQDGATSRSIPSNVVSLEVVRPVLSIETFRPLANGGLTSPVNASLCGNRPLMLMPGQQNADNSQSLEQTDQLRAGEILVFRISAALANRDPSAIDTITVALTDTSGDRETLTVFETGVNSGVFAGAIRTRSLAQTVVPGDCQLSVQSGDRIDITVTDGAAGTAIVTAQVTVLADPFSFVFDSEDGTPVSGARVTLIDTATGQPANVFAEDGVTPWPSTIITGQPVADGAGNIIPLSPGEYRFPLVVPGNYEVRIEPPSPYTAPSEVPRDGFSGLIRPDGAAFVINDASYGGVLAIGVGRSRPCGYSTGSPECRGFHHKIRVACQRRARGCGFLHDHAAK